MVKRKKQFVDQELKNKENDLARMSAYIVSKNDLLNSIVSDLEYHTSLIENKKDRKLMTPLKKKISEKSYADDPMHLEISNFTLATAEHPTIKYEPIIRIKTIKKVILIILWFLNKSIRYLLRSPDLS